MLLFDNNMHCRYDTNPDTFQVQIDGEFMERVDVAQNCYNTFKSSESALIRWK